MLTAFFLAVRGVLAKIPSPIWLTLAAAALVIFWGNSRYNEGREDEAAKRDAIVAAAVLKAVEAERKAVAAHAEREGKRQADTQELREVAENAPVGTKVEAVLDALRSN